MEKNVSVALKNVNVTLKNTIFENKNYSVLLEWRLRTFLSQNKNLEKNVFWNCWDYPESWNRFLRFQEATLSYDFSQSKVVFMFFLKEAFQSILTVHRKNTSAWGLLLTVGYTLLEAPYSEALPILYVSQKYSPVSSLPLPSPTLALFPGLGHLIKPATSSLEVESELVLQ